jgi:hypothetical protein
MVVVNVRRVEATMNIQGVEETLPKSVPIAAITILSAIIFFVPNLSEIIPLGMLKRNWKMLGIAIMRPTC